MSCLGPLVCKTRDKPEPSVAETPASQCPHFGFVCDGLNKPFLLQRLCLIFIELARFRVNGNLVCALLANTSGKPVHFFMLHAF